MRLYLIRLYYTLMDVEKELREVKEYEWADRLKNLIRELQEGVIHEKPRQSDSGSESFNR